MRLEDKSAIVTGGGNGIGRGICLAFAAEGANIAVVDLDGSAAEDVAREIDSTGGTAFPVTVDVADAEGVQRMATTVADAFGGIDILVNNAGYATTIDFVDIPEEEFDKVLDANLKGAFLLSQLAVPSMKRRGGGKIVNLTSTVSMSGPGDLVHYVAAKSGVIGMTRALARALGPFNITVNALAPGMVATEPIIALYPAEVLDRSAAGRAIQRWEYAEDLVGTLTFLCSPASDFMTGQTIFVDGGHVFD
ncbi:MAG: glucose 1-dehydrogenase [Alphaproteobacteria bacterium]|nr:glucose 1-dehydrogenase [Alphaproteobacteria bacterium]